MVHSYKIQRLFADERRPKIVARGLTLEEAQAHCRKESTHKKDKNGRVVWFDGYAEE